MNQSTVEILNNVVRMNNEGLSALCSSGSNSRPAVQSFRNALRTMMSLTEVGNMFPTGSEAMPETEALCSWTTVPIASSCNSDRTGFYTCNQAIYLNINSCESLIRDTPQGTIRFITIVVLWNTALATYQWAHACLASGCAADRQRATALFRKSTLLYTQLVTFCNHNGDGNGMGWTDKPQVCIFLTLAAMNNYTWVCLELDMIPESKFAQSELTRLLGRPDEYCSLSSEQSEIVNEFSLNTVLLSMTGYFSEVAASAA